MKKVVLLIGLVITCAIFFPIQASGWSADAIKYFYNLKNYSWPRQASGSFIGNFSNPNVQSSSGDYFHKIGWEYEVHFCFTEDVPVVGDIVGAVAGVFGGGGCLYEYTQVYGAMLNWDFNVRGPVNYNYNIPFTASLNFPNTVYPGQRIYLDPTFVWGTPQVGATQGYESSLTTSTWLDFPLDFIDTLSTNYTQYAPKAHLDGQIPIAPIVPAIPFNTSPTDIPFPGRGSWGGSTTQLGATGTLNTSGNRLVSWEATKCSADAYGDSGYAWYQGHEQFELVATVLQYIPYTAPIGAGLNYVRELLGLQLTTGLTGSIYRGDQINLELSESPYIDVPLDLKPGTTWSFSLPVTVKYRVQGWSGFSYPISCDVNFAMRGMETKHFLDLPVTSISAGQASIGWQEKVTQINLKGSVPVVSKFSYNNALIVAPASFVQFYNPPGIVSLRISPFKSGVKVASLQDTQRVIRTKATVFPPKPTVKVGVPLKGQYTVILGKTYEATGQQIINALKSKAITGFMVAVPGSQEKVITLGSFANRKSAETLSGMLSEVFRIESIVSQVIDSKSYVPIKSDVLIKLSK